MQSNDPIFYLDDVMNCGECKTGCHHCDQRGYYPPGWYFWNETWSMIYGPFKTREQTEVELAKYAKTI
jgi:hypothetical protein